MRLLLINPKFPESFWSFKWAIDTVMPAKRAINPPLGLATLAALCPADWEVAIVDENIESIPLKPRADVVGICGMGVQYPRQKELLSFYRSRGYYVVAGGSYASLCPERYESLADTVVAGEAEYIWRQFCRDLERGVPEPVYRETGTVSMTDSPTPRFDLLRLDRYQTVSLQFSRGCPYRCEFCDIIVMFGREPRTKSLQQVGKELDALRELGMHHAFFVDDNLIGNKKLAKELLRFLRDYQQEHDYQFDFGTEASLNLAQDGELLTLFREANFKWVFIGIESPDEASLRETKKFQNLRQDLLSSVRRIYSFGIDVLAGFIIGFDNDTNTTFERQYRFIMSSGIQTAMVGLLVALPRTPLYVRLEKEGRLVPDADVADNTKLVTNVIPKQMTYDQMVSGYRALHERLLTHRSIADRIRNKCRYLVPALRREERSIREGIGMLTRLLVHGLVRGGPSAMFHFCRSIPLSSPRLVPQAIKDWIVGLAMRDYASRHLVGHSAPMAKLVDSHVESMKRVLRHYVQQDALEVSLRQVKDAAATVSVRMKGWLDRGFFIRAGHHLERVLRDTASSVTLRIDELHEGQLRHLHRLLRRLSRYGDRIEVAVRDELRDMVEIDSSVFNLVLEVSPSG
ncbi:MAG: radical SAM protein [Gemmatimonadota bacterium]